METLALITSFIAGYLFWGFCAAWALEIGHPRDTLKSFVKAWMAWPVVIIKGFENDKN